MCNVYLNTSNVNAMCMWDLRFWWWWISISWSTGRWHYIVLWVDSDVSEESAASIYKVEFANLKMKAAGSSQMLVPNHEAMKCHIPEDCKLVVLIFSYSLWCVVVPSYNANCLGE